MNKQGSSKTRRHARAIKTKRDFESAAHVARGLAGKTGLDTAAELRLQLLLKELDKFDTPEEDAEGDYSPNEDFPARGRRWSDENSGRE